MTDLTPAVLDELERHLALGGTAVSEEQLRSLLSAVRECDKLRQIVSECAVSSGAHVAPSCSIEFMGRLPEDIRLRRERESAEIKRLRFLLKVCSDDLAERIENHYRGSLIYPDERLRHDRDMDIVRHARAELEGKTDG